MQFPKKTAEQLHSQQQAAKESYFTEKDASRTMFGHIWFKMKQNPAIPLGTISHISLRASDILHDVCIS
jgi:hypothetical protein